MEDLIEKNMGLVMTIVNRFKPSQLILNGTAIYKLEELDLWKALDEVFSRTRNARLAPYAWRPIRWEIIKEIRSNAPKENSIYVDPNRRTFG